MSKVPTEPGDNIVAMPAAVLKSHAAARELRRPRAGVGSADDPRTQEAMRLVEAFLAIEDAQARMSLIAIAERLVSHDWVRNAHRR